MDHAAQSVIGSHPAMGDLKKNIVRSIQSGVLNVPKEQHGALRHLLKTMVPFKNHEDPMVSDAARNAESMLKQVPEDPPVDIHPDILHYGIMLHAAEHYKDTHPQMSGLQQDLNRRSPDGVVHVGSENREALSYLLSNISQYKDDPNDVVSHAARKSAEMLDSLNQKDEEPEGLPHYDISSKPSIENYITFEGPQSRDLLSVLKQYTGNAVYRNGTYHIPSDKSSEALSAVQERMSFLRQDDRSKAYQEEMPYLLEARYILGRMQKSA